MIKRTIIETVEEFDENGKLTRKITTETKEDDGTAYPAYPSYEPVPWWVNHKWEPSVTIYNNKAGGGGNSPSYTTCTK